jgi:hypothetical protein
MLDLRYTPSRDHDRSQGARIDGAQVHSLPGDTHTTGSMALISSTHYSDGEAEEAETQPRASAFHHLATTVTLVARQQCCLDSRF